MNNNEKYNAEFTNRMIELRKQKGWSQEELGERLGVSRQTVSKWELGESKPKMSKIIEMSKLYNLTMDELINGKDETKPVEIETKVVNDNNTEIIENRKVEEIKDIITINNNYKNENLNESFLRRHLRKIIIIIAVLLLIAYLGLSVYKFCILKEINDKFNEYKNVTNCYLERKEIVTNNTTGEAYIINERYWYKDDLVKIENIKTENGVTKTYYKYIDLNRQEIYIVNENTRNIIKKENIDEYIEFKDGILEYVIGENYYKDNIDIIKNSLNILKNVSIKKDKYIKKSINQNGNAKKIYNKENGFIQQSYTLNNSEEIKILYNIEIDIVKDEDVNIKFLNLENYEIIEQ